MTSDAIALGRRGKSGELQAIGLVSAAHFVAHFHMLVLPPLFPFLTQHFGIGFVELGFALTIGAVASVAAQVPMGYLADRLGARRLLILALCLGGSAIASIGLVDSYRWLLVAAALIGSTRFIIQPITPSYQPGLPPPASARLFRYILSPACLGARSRRRQCWSLRRR